MKLILPPGVSASRFNRALDAFAAIVGREWVLSTDEDRDTYLDAYAPGAEESHAPAAAVAPADVAQIQAVLRVANEYRIPLWPISRGKNFGYGGAAPRMPGTVMLDLGRLNRIIEVNERFGYCIVEPGVGFFDLHEYLNANNIPLQPGVPGNGWGSVIGNALERGFSTAIGDNSANICGMELVLANGDIVRTGMGAMENSPSWPLYKHGYGPSWDQLIVQSNFAIVTKMCLWLRPLDEMVVNIDVKLDQPEEIEWFTQAATPLRLRGIVSGLVRLTSHLASATMPTLRREWYTGPGSIPDDVIDRIKSRYGVGWWNGGLRIAGPAEVCEAQLKIALAELAKYSSKEFPVTRSPGRRGPPSTSPLQLVNWYGGRGGHIGFSPAMPADGRLVREQFERTRRRYIEFGLDYSGTFYNDGRACTNVNLIIYDRDDADMKRRVRELFLALIADAKQMGYGEYRTHLSYMDDVAESYDFNRHALRRLNERVKDALDPNGVIAPGRNGIWPAAYRNQRGKL
jgi:4-cresol dehydrogenase (hydroxylating)